MRNTRGLPGRAGELHDLPLARLRRDAAAGQGRSLLDAEVTKMVKVYHAPIEPAQAKAIAAYLGAAY